MTAQLSKGPLSPVELHSKWKCRRTTSVWSVIRMSASGASVTLAAKKDGVPFREMRVTTLRRDYEEIK